MRDEGVDVQVVLLCQRLVEDLIPLVVNPVDADVNADLVYKPYKRAVPVVSGPQLGQLLSVLVELLLQLLLLLGHVLVDVVAAQPPGLYLLCPVLSLAVLPLPHLAQVLLVLGKWAVGYPQVTPLLLLLVVTVVLIVRVHADIYSLYKQAKTGYLRAGRSRGRTKIKRKQKRKLKKQLRG